MNVRDIIDALSKQYNFSTSDANQYIQRLSENNLNDRQSDDNKNRCETKRKKMILPFCSVICKDACKNLKVNHGLFTQCTNKIDNHDNELCKTCSNSLSNNGNKYPIGRIEDRFRGEPMKFVSNSGKLVTSFGDVIKKLQISRKDIDEYAVEQGVIIPEVQFIETKRKRGRPRKEVSTYDTDNEDQIDETNDNVTVSNSNVVTEQTIVKRGRGRPKKDKKTISIKTIQNNYISDLLRVAQKKFPEKNNDDNNDDGDGDDGNNYDSGGDDSSSDDSSSDDSSSDDSGSDDSSSDDSSSHDSSSDDSSSDDSGSDDEVEQIQCVSILFKGKQYIKSLEDNLIYDRETEEHIGCWKNDTIVFKK